MSQSIDELSVALVREFLSRKGLKETLGALDDELPRTAGSISNRVTLAKDLGIESLLKKNKTLPSPYKTMVEVMVKYFVDKKPGHTSSAHPPPPTTAPPPTTYHPPPTTPSPDHALHPGSSRSLHPKDADATNAGGHFVAHGNPITSSDANVISCIDKQKTTDGSVPSEQITVSRGVVSSVGRKVPLGGMNTGTVVHGSHGKNIKARHFKPRGLGDFSEILDPPSDPHSGVGVVNGGGVGQSVEQSVTSRQNPAAVQRRGLNVSMGATNVTDTTKNGRETKTLVNMKPDRGVQSKADSAHVDLLCEDLETEDLSIQTTDIQEERGGQDFPKGEPIPAETAKKLRQLLFGSAKKTFSGEWKRQNLVFSSSLPYGLVQHKGGPCGVMASLQAYVLKYLMFSNQKHISTIMCHDINLPSPQPSPSELTMALCSALADILWKVGGCAEAVVALNSMHSGSSSICDPLTDGLAVYSFASRERLHGFIASHLHEFQDDGSSGCVLLTVSAILSRTIHKIREDMDEKEGSLIGAHGYCTQELVNLLLCGVAISNVFNGNMELDSGGAETNTLKGIPRQNEIGLLSLFEHYQSCSVGSHYKDPVYPIWVVCSESHFSVLFSTHRNLLTKGQEAGQFDLFYYDGLARQEEEIRLTVDTRTVHTAPRGDDLIPPLELCIRTKWKNATVSWNGTEPIL